MYKAIKFRNVELLKHERLGVGSYGSVYKANCDGVICAAKIIHPTLVSPSVPQYISPQRRHRLPGVRFELECDFLKDIRHPNIIQFLGMHHDLDTGLPVLLMELMDESLTHFLETSTDATPMYVEVTISLDIVTALAFLHLNSIVHRDLSSNNILLIGKGIRAKLSDFGMAKLINANTSNVSNTMNPGTDVYMPPEAVDKQAEYTEKGDVFSFGVNIIQILTKKFPNPGGRFKTLQIDHPQIPTGKVEVRTSEVERRSNHINEIIASHPLLPIALSCLKDQKADRPSATELCQYLCTLKESTDVNQGSPKYTQERIAELEHMVLERDQLLEAKDLQLKSKEDVIDRLQTEDEQQQISLGLLTDELHKTHEALNERERVLEKERKEHAQAVAYMEGIITEMKPDLNPLSIPLPSTDVPEISTLPNLEPLITPQPQPSEQACSRTELKGDLVFRWRPGDKALQEMYQATDAVVIGDVAYFRPAQTRKVYSFNSITEQWSRYPACPNEYSTIAAVNGLLTSIGGSEHPLLEAIFVVNKCSKKLFSLTGEGWDRNWAEIFPPMPTKRKAPIAVTTKNVLIVAGGAGDATEPLTVVEIMNIDTKQWSRVVDLPEPVWSASATIQCGERLYLCHQSSVFTCSITVLLRSVSLFSSASQEPVWTVLSKLPVYQATLICIKGRVLAIGGRGCDLAAKPSNTIWMYNRNENNWIAISHITSPRWRCFVANFRDHKVMVIGGLKALDVGLDLSNTSLQTDSIEYSHVN